MRNRSTRQHRLLVLLLSVAVVALWVVAYFYVRHPVPWYPKQHHRLEVWANIGSAFTTFATLASSLGLVALIWTIWVQIDQLKTIEEGQRDTAKQAHFLMLEKRVGETIGDSEINYLKKRCPHADHKLDHWFKGELPEADSDLAQALFRRLGELPAINTIPVHDGFRRRKLFRAIKKLLDDCSSFQRNLFKDSLNAQIHDEAARMLILKSLAENDTETLTIFGQLGIQFSVLNEIPEIARRLARAFPED